VRSHTAIYIFGLEGQVPESRAKGETIYISAIAEYGWYEWVKFRYTAAAASFPVSKIQLGRDLGAAIDISPAILRKILKENGQVLYRTYVRSLTLDEIHSPTEIAEHFADFVTPTFELYEDNEVPASKMPDIDDVDTYDQYVGAKVRVPIGGEMRSGKVMRQNRGLAGTWKRRANANVMLDFRTYEIEFQDGCSDEYTTHIIAENMYAQCDYKGNQFNIMDCIVDHKKDGHVVERADMYIKHGRNKQVRKTTKD
jgi:hypothetical protein